MNGNFFAIQLHNIENKKQKQIQNIIYEFIDSNIDIKNQCKICSEEVDTITFTFNTKKDIVWNLLQPQIKNNNIEAIAIYTENNFEDYEILYSSYKETN